MNFGKILGAIGGGLAGGIPGAVGGAMAGPQGALGGAGLGWLLSNVFGGHSGGQTGMPEPFHNGFVDKRAFDPSGAGISYKGGGAFDVPGYEMFGDLIPFDTAATSINGIPTSKFREQRAKHYGGKPSDYGGSAGDDQRFQNYLPMFGGGMFGGR